MKERGIIFSAKMVRAILAKRKSQTRRVVKPQPVLADYPDVWAWQARRGGPHYVGDSLPDLVEILTSEGPYQVGDHLWIRETWGGIFLDSCSGHYLQWRNVSKSDRTQERCEGLFYRSDGDDLDYEGCWVSPIFMPRWASRLTLEVLSIRAERLRDISYEDIIAEGVYQVWPLSTTAQLYVKDLLYEKRARETFSRFWDSLNKKPKFKFATNPWVHVVEFGVLEP